HVEASHCLREALDLKAETPTLIRRAAVRSELGADAWGWGVRGEGHGAGVALVVDAATVVDDVPRQRAPDRARARDHSLDDGRVAREVDGRGEGPVALHLDVERHRVVPGLRRRPAARLHRRPDAQRDAPSEPSDLEAENEILARGPAVLADHGRKRQ